MFKLLYIKSGVMLLMENVYHFNIMFSCWFQVNHQLNFESTFIYIIQNNTYFGMLEAPLNP